MEASFEEKVTRLDVWTDTWLRPDWTTCTKSGKNTVNQIQFVGRFIEIMQLMADQQQRKKAVDEMQQARSSAAAAPRRSNAYDQ